MYGVILDTTPLKAFFKLDIIKLLSLFYSEILIPVAVESEFLIAGKNASEQEKTSRLKWLMNIYAENQDWIKKCTDYNDAVVAIYSSIPKIDKGEAEVFAQCQTLENKYSLVIDERVAFGVAKDYSYKVLGTLNILAKLELETKSADYFELSYKLKNDYNFYFKDEVIDLVYKKVKEELSTRI